LVLCPWGIGRLDLITSSDWGPATEALTERGFAVLPAALSQTGWQNLRNEAEQLRTDGAFAAARVGRGAGVRHDRETRGDSVCWIDGSMPAGDAFLAWMDGLRVVLNRTLFLGLDEFEAHYAHYPTGSSYGTHVDRHQDSDARVVSAVAYLNGDWPDDAGGELVLYDDHAVPLLTLAPAGGTLVLFMSEGTPHEARQATRDRWSIAGWFRTPAPT
jgi:SM-20-related protein